MVYTCSRCHWQSWWNNYDIFSFAVTLKLNWTELKWTRADKWADQTHVINHKIYQTKASVFRLPTNHIALSIPVRKINKNQTASSSYNEKETVTPFLLKYSKLNGLRIERLPRHIFQNDRVLLSLSSQQYEDLPQSQAIRSCSNQYVQSIILALRTK